MAFRVIADHTSGETKISPPAAVDWKEASVTIITFPDFPLSGDSTKRRVTLTATADGPSNVRYQWQEYRGSDWIDLGSASTSNTKRVSSTSRGTKKYRVKMLHSTASLAISPAEYVTWDYWDIVSKLVKAVHDEIETHSTYTTAQTALVTCMNPPAGGASGNATSTPPLPGGASESSSTTFSTFDDILAVYTGKVKAKMDSGGAYHSKATAMFNAIEMLGPTKLAVVIRKRLCIRELA